VAPVGLTVLVAADADDRRQSPGNIAPRGQAARWPRRRAAGVSGVEHRSASPHRFAPPTLRLPSRTWLPAVPRAAWWTLTRWMTVACRPAQPRHAWEQEQVLRRGTGAITRIIQDR